MSHTLANYHDPSALILQQNASMLDDLQRASAHVDNSSDSSSHDLDLDLPVGIVMSILGVIVMATNGIALTASRYTTGGRCPEMIFVRTLCAADALTGLYGVVRPIQMLACPRWPNRFLPEALLFTSFVASNLTLVLATVDCYIRICHRALFYVNKTTIIFTLVVLWNVAFVVGFVPQMDLNDVDGASSFFCFYNADYLVFIVTIFVACMLPSVALLVYMRVRTRRSEPISCMFYSAELARDIVSTVQLDVAAQIVFSAPVAAYLMLHCYECRLNEGDTTLLLFLGIVILSKSLLSAVLHCVNTKKIKMVLVAFGRHYCCVRFTDHGDGTAIATITRSDDGKARNAAAHFKHGFRSPNAGRAVNGYYNPVSLERMPYHCFSSAGSVSDLGVQQDTSSSTIESDPSPTSSFFRPATTSWVRPSSVAYVRPPTTSWVRPPSNRSYVVHPNLVNLSDYYEQAELVDEDGERTHKLAHVGCGCEERPHTLGHVNEAFMSLNYSDICAAERGETDNSAHWRSSLEHDDVSSWRENVTASQALEDRGQSSGSLRDATAACSNNSGENKNKNNHAQVSVKGKRSQSLTDHGAISLDFLADGRKEISGSAGGENGKELGDDAVSQTLSERMTKYKTRSQSLLDGLKLAGTRLGSLLERDESRVAGSHSGRPMTARSCSLPDHPPVFSSDVTAYQPGSNSLFPARQKKKPSLLRLALDAEISRGEHRHTQLNAEHRHTEHRHTQLNTEHRHTLLNNDHRDTQLNSEHRHAQLNAEHRQTQLNTEHTHTQLNTSKPVGRYAPANVDPLCPVHGRMRKRVIPACNPTETNSLKLPQQNKVHLYATKRSDSEKGGSGKDHNAPNTAIRQFPLRVNLDDYIAGFKKMRSPHSEHLVRDNSPSHSLRSNTSVNGVGEVSHQRLSRRCDSDRLTRNSTAAAARAKLPSRAATSHNGCNYDGSLMHKTTVSLARASNDLAAEQMSMQEAKSDDPVNSPEFRDSSRRAEKLSMLETVLIHNQIDHNIDKDEAHSVTHDVDGCRSEKDGSLVATDLAVEINSCDRSNANCHRAVKNISVDTSDVDCHRAAGEHISCDTSDIDRHRTENDSRDMSIISVTNVPPADCSAETIPGVTSTGNRDSIAWPVVPGYLTNGKSKDRAVYTLDYRAAFNGELKPRMRENGDINILNHETLGNDENIVIDTRM